MYLDERFADVMSRRRNWRDLRPILEQALSRYMASEIQEIVLRIGGVAMPANTIETLNQDPQAIAMNIIRETPRPGRVPLRYIALPWEFSEMEPVPPHPLREVPPEHVQRAGFGDEQF